jgi:hypothetical protein
MTFLVKEHAQPVVGDVVEHFLGHQRVHSLDNDQARDGWLRSISLDLPISS